MPKTTLYNINAEQVGEIELSDDIFGFAVNAGAMHTMVVSYLANQRQGTQSTKTRTEVRGGGKKPWRQKGTGRARQGSIRSPQWTGGGVALGPKPRSYRFAVNKKLRRVAMKSALSSKAGASEIIVLEDLSPETYKTKEFAAILSKFGTDNALIVTAEKNENAVRGARNIPNVKTTLVTTLNVYDILKYGKFIVTRDAVAKIEEVYA
ncbi:MAG: 50S ribosomal protein L4 [Clostridiales bacterium]|jgi:large subunit ribosomal protein L4|nr:50S ribosomal protein L4 [Clostridiales bacterium]